MESRNFRFNLLQRIGVFHHHQQLQDYQQIIENNDLEQLLECENQLLNNNLIRTQLRDRLSDKTTVESLIEKQNLNILNEHGYAVSQSIKIWYSINTNHEFEYMYVKSKNVLIIYDNFVKLKWLSLGEGQMGRLLIPDQSFGLYALPHSECNRLFFGPYKLGEDHNIVFEMKNIPKKKMVVVVSPYKTRELHLLNMAASNRFNFVKMKFLLLHKRFKKTDPEEIEKRMIEFTGFDNLAFQTCIYRPSVREIPILFNNIDLLASTNDSDHSVDDIVNVNNTEDVFEISDSE